MLSVEIETHFEEGEDQGKGGWGSIEELLIKLLGKHCQYTNPPCHMIRTYHHNQALRVWYICIYVYIYIHIYIYF